MFLIPYVWAAGPVALPRGGKNYFGGKPDRDCTFDCQLFSGATNATVWNVVQQELLLLPAFPGAKVIEVLNI